MLDFKRPRPEDQREFDALLSSIDGLSMKLKRQLYSAMRNGASMNTLIPRIGMTLGEISMYLVLRDKA